MAQKHYDIARSRGIPIKDILHFDITMQSCLFTDDDLTEKPNKYEIVKELEKNLDSSQYIFRKFSELKTTAIMDSMSQVRKIPDEKIKLKLKKMSDIFESGLSSILSTVNVERVDIVYDSYLESSIKECERMRRRSKCQPLEFIGLTEDSPIPTQLDRFWACSKNKENLQILSRTFFKDYSRDKSMQMFLSGYVTDSNDLHSSEVCVNGLSELYPELNSYIEEADGRIIPHVADAIKNGFQRIVIHSNDSDVVVYLLHYTHDFLQLGAAEIWIR